MAFQVSKYLLSSVKYHDSVFISVDDDIDGIPLDKMTGLKSGGFIPSKWETVDPDQIEAQAITTSKWDTLDPVAPEPPSFVDYSNDDDSSDDNSRSFDDDKRSRLRQIEVKIMQYQDELESGARSLKAGWTINQQCEHYRRKLTKKSYKELMQPEVSTESPGDRYAQRKELSRRSPSLTSENR